MAPLVGLPVQEYSRGRMSYDLRRLRLHGLIERIPFTQRVALQEVRPGSSAVPGSALPPSPGRPAAFR